MKRTINKNKKIKNGGAGPNSDDKKFMMEMRKRYMADSMNPGLPLDIAPGMKRKSKSKSRSVISYISIDFNDTIW